MMVTTALGYQDARYHADPGMGYDGVCRVIHGDYYGTGALLANGRVVLTAAHLFYRNDGRTGDQTRVVYETVNGSEVRNVEHVMLHPDYDPVNSNNDLALVWLSRSAPVYADRYEIYRDDNENNRVFEFVGYGQAGTGQLGVVDDLTHEFVRLRAFNRFETDAATLRDRLGEIMGWTPQTGQLMVADFDSGWGANDALGSFLGQRDLGLSVWEGMISSGDSGGPAFIDGKIAGIASYGSVLATRSIDPDIDLSLNSSFGELGFWQRVSVHQQWIDQMLRSHYPSAPVNPDQVVKQVSEGDIDTNYAYFLVQFHGERNNANQWVSVDYSTRDGTAIGGEDYIPLSGTLILYPGERYAVIPVEIIGDQIPEQDEYFYLDIFNPVGGYFESNSQVLTAVRTIVNDDVTWI